MVIYYLSFSSYLRIPPSKNYKRQAAKYNKSSPNAEYSQLKISVDFITILRLETMQESGQTHQNQPDLEEVKYWYKSDEKMIYASERSIIF